MFKYTSFFLLFFSSFTAFSEKPASTYYTTNENTWEKIKNAASDYARIDHIFLDNKYIQSYKGIPGIWFKVASKNLLPSLGKKFGFTLEFFKKINVLSNYQITKIDDDYHFLPYSEKYLNKLKLHGLSQLEVDVPRGEFIWPVKGERITSRLGARWNRQHTGLDIAVSTGTIVVAAKEGKITVAGRHGAYGIAVIVDHGGNYNAIYGHLKESFVKKGDYVKKGQIIGLSGNTGKSTGPHLHFEIRCVGIVLNPENFLPNFNESMKAVFRFESAFLNDTSLNRY